MDISTAMAGLCARRQRDGGEGIPHGADVAAAVAFVPAGLPRHLLLHRHGTAMESPVGDALVRELEQRIAREWARREMARIRGHLSAALGGVPDAAATTRCDATEWPALMVWRSMAELHIDARYRAIIGGVLQELRTVERCACRERPSGVRGGCACEGTGYGRQSGRERAAACGLCWSTYQRTWAPVYAWLWSECVVALGKAEQRFCEALWG